MKYADFGFKDNPFPPPPAMLNPFSLDSKVNGQIFATKARETELAAFLSKFVHPESFQNRYRLGFLWAKGDPEERGQGKTAFLVYLRHRINDGWGSKMIPNEKACALYVDFPTEIKDYPLEHISQLALASCIRDGVFSQVKFSLENEAKESGITDIKNSVFERLVTKRVERQFARAIADGNAEDYLKSMRKDSSLDIPRPPRDTLLLTKTNNLFFTHTVRALQTGGFTGGFLFIDDIERITDLPGRKHLETFAKNLGIILFRSDSEQAIGRFFTVVLTTHANAAAKLSSAWVSAGLAGVYPINPEADNSIELPKLSTEGALEIFDAYIRAARTGENITARPYDPFETDAAHILVEWFGNHPRFFLSNAHSMLEQARTSNVRVLDKDFVGGYLKSIHVPKVPTRLPEGFGL